MHRRTLQRILNKHAPENSKTLSIVIPVFNEVNFLEELFDK